MMTPVNIGIDLGTTNSLIARYENGAVRVYKNPVGQKETLASVVAFRKERILVGDKAREFLTKDPINVFGGFKRKMGTDEKYYVVNLDENITPVGLSTHVLQELKQFLKDQDNLNAAVVTIPASFDSMQSNATIQAGKAAGIKDVFLLQEPIAASLAFFNTMQIAVAEEEDSHWLVYDFGGGTFDVALVSVKDGALKVVDHEGDNFLGGMNFDDAIIDNIIIPAIAEQTGIEGLAQEIKVKYGKYEMLYHKILYYAEEAKKEFAAGGDASIDFTEEIDGKDYDFFIPLENEKVSALFMPIIEETILLLNKVLKNNNLRSIDIKQLILVGGSTFLPQVRTSLLAATGIATNYDLDPVNAIAVGAAYYAANKYFEPASNEKTEEKGAHAADEILSTVSFVEVPLQVEVAYNRSSRDAEEVLMLNVEGEYEKCFYRIWRSDGGFDTAKVPLREKVIEFLPLLTGTNNIFTLHIFDEQHNEFTTLARELNILQGIYNIEGQPLPHDICLEVDDAENKTTKLEIIFERNSLLPQKRTLYREVSKTIRKGENDSIVLSILEGDGGSRPSSNLTIGCIEIKGKELQSDLVKGSDVEIKIEVSESRSLSVNVFLVMTQQEFTHVFSISEKQVNLSRLRDQFLQLEQELGYSIRGFQYNDNDIWEIEAMGYLEELESIKEKLFKLKENEKSDDKYIIAAKVSRISKDADKLGGNERISGMLEEYMYRKKMVAEVISQVDFDKDSLVKTLQKIESSESTFIKSKNASVVQNKVDQLYDLHLKALSNTTSYLIERFIDYKGLSEDWFKDYRAAKSIMKMADKTLEEEKFSEFRRQVYSISHLLKDVRAELNKDFKGTGIG